ncbi:transporter [Rubrivirga sp.]|uniref:transporter n=1 Tax=Rubrivirga sp. TaxID=1885344 RepID=UPI003B52563E
MFRLALALLLASPAAAQIVTDRPDLTESTEAVRRLQVESGLLLDVEDSGSGGGSPDLSGPQALVRVPVVAGVEVRLGLPDYRVEDVANRNVDGLTDPSVGAKVELGAAGPWALAAIAEVSLPLGDAAFSGAASPLAILVAGRDAGAFSLGTQAEVRWDRDADRVEVGGTFVVGTSVSEAVGVFVEAAAGTTPGDPAVLAQTGATLLLSPDVQLDAALGLGLTEPAPDVFAGVGVSARF